MRLDPEEAAGDALMRVRDFAGAAHVWRRLRQSQPDQFAWWRKEIDALIAARNVAEARLVLRDASVALPASDAVIPLEIRLATAERRWQEVEALCVSLGGDGPGSTEAVLGLYDALLRQNKQGVASTQLRAALQFDHHDPDARLRGANTALQHNFFAEADELAETYLAQVAQDADALWCCATAKAKLGRFAEAEELVTRGLKHAPHHPLLPVLAAEVATALEHWDDAVSRWSFLIRTQPSRSWRRLRLTPKATAATPWIQLAIAEVRRGDSTAAFAILDAAGQRFGEDLIVWRTRADLAATVGDWPRSGAAWVEILARGVNDQDAVSSCCFALWKAAQSPRSPSADNAHLICIRPEVRAANDLLKKIDASVVMAPSESGSVEFLENAYVVPGTPVTDVIPSGERRYVCTSGVFYNNGLLSQNSLQIGPNLFHSPNFLFGSEKMFDYLPGTYLFGGADMSNHIGHFIMECTGRFWYSESINSGVLGIIFLDKSRLEATNHKFDLERLQRRIHKRYGASSDTIRQISAIFGGSANVHVLHRPTIVQNLVVPQQLMALTRTHFNANPLFHAHVRKAVDRAIGSRSARPRRRVYVSRSRFQATRGAMFPEAALEELVKSNGYEIFYPEALSIKEQLAVYRDSSHIVVAGGSAAHIVALSMDNQQKVAVVARHARQSVEFAAQIQAFGAIEAVSLDHVNGHFTATNRTTGERVNFNDFTRNHSLDLTKIALRLRDEGFIEDISSLDRFDLNAEITKFIKIMELTYVDCEIAHVTETH